MEHWQAIMANIDANRSDLVIPYLRRINKNDGSYEYFTTLAETEIFKPEYEYIRPWFWLIAVYDRLETPQHTTPHQVSTNLRKYFEYWNVKNEYVPIYYDHLDLNSIDDHFIKRIQKMILSLSIIKRGPDSTGREMEIDGTMMQDFLVRFLSMMSLEHRDKFNIMKRGFLQNFSIEELKTKGHGATGVTMMNFFTTEMIVQPPNPGDPFKVKDTTIDKMIHSNFSNVNLPMDEKTRAPVKSNTDFLKYYYLTKKANKNVTKKPISEKEKETYIFPVPQPKKKTIIPPSPTPSLRSLRSHITDVTIMGDAISIHSTPVPQVTDNPMTIEEIKAAVNGLGLDSPIPAMGSVAEAELADVLNSPVASILPLNSPMPTVSVGASTLSRGMREDMKSILGPDGRYLRADDIPAFVEALNQWNLPSVSSDEVDPLATHPDAKGATQETKFFTGRRKPGILPLLGTINPYTGLPFDKEKEVKEIKGDTKKNLIDDIREIVCNEDPRITCLRKMVGCPTMPHEQLDARILASEKLRKALLRTEIPLPSVPTRNLLGKKKKRKRKIKRMARSEGNTQDEEESLTLRLKNLRRTS